MNSTIITPVKRYCRRRQMWCYQANELGAYILLRACGIRKSILKNNHEFSIRFRDSIFSMATILRKD